VRASVVLFIVFLAALFALGLHIGREVASLPRLESFKLLNILGLTLDLLGLLILSEYVVTSERLKAFVVGWVAGLVLWSLTVLPIGAWLGAATFTQGASSAKASEFFLNLFAYVMLPLAVLDAAVANPIQPMSRDRTARVRRFGLLLLLAGTVVQLLAAFQDVYA